MDKKQKTIIDEMDEFRTLLIGFTVLRKKIIKGQKLTSEEDELFGSLFNEISIDAGKYGPLIKEITGLETLHTSAGPQDIWNWALSSAANTLVVSALDNCISATSRTIGTLKKDIDNGLRDKKTGNLLSLQISKVEATKAFIAHGKGGGALLKLERFLRELGVTPIIVKDQPNLDRTVDDKVQDYLNEVDFVIIFATGDDVIKGKEKDIKQPRQNVIHEIGLAQKTHPGKIIYLLEEGAEFPSNIRPKVYESFARQSLDEAFIAIVRELRNWGFITAGTIRSKT